MENNMKLHLYSPDKYFLILLILISGLEKMNPFEIMRSKRWKKNPNGIMFKELFKYIAGVNKVSSFFN